MNFKDILSDIDKLVGKQLQSINPSTAPIFLIKVDFNSKKYFISNDSNKKGTGRSFWELEDIWSELVNKGFCNVDQALYGSGSSRNQPETLFANLPYIQHFKYQKRKHLLLREEGIHQLGTLSELPDKETKSIRNQIENQSKLSFQHLNSAQVDAVEHIQKALSVISAKYSGDIELKDIDVAMSKLVNVQKVINDATVSIDLRLNIYEAKEENPLRKMKLENLADAPEVTGVYDGDNDEDEGINSELIPESKRINSNIRHPLNTPRIRQLNPTFSLLYDRLRYEELKIPEYQRNGGIWGLKESSKLIESILLGLPLPIFYFAEKENGDWVIVDGLQRITTMFNFIKNDLKLTGLNELVAFNGLKFQDIDRASQRKFREFQLTSYVIDMSEGDNRFISELFHRINTFGVKLSPQEMRNAVNIGASVKFLRDLANTNDFLRITNEKVNPIRQKDLELCLSAVSFMIYGYKEYNYNKQDDFLSETMDFLNNISSDRELKIKNAFIGGLLISEKIFGNESFIKELNPKKSSPISKPLFELIVSVFSNLSEEQKIELINNKDDFIEKLYGAIREDKKDYASWESEVYTESERGFNYSISQSTGKRVTILYRFESLLNILDRVCNIKVDFKRMFHDK